jgi:hypothetical protein
MQAASADPTCSRRHSAEGPQAEMVKDGHNGSYLVRNMKIREDQSRKSETIPWTQVVEVCVFLITFCNLLVELGNLSHTSAVAELFSIVFPCLWKPQPLSTFGTLTRVSMRVEVSWRLGAGPVTGACSIWARCVFGFTTIWTNGHQIATRCYRMLYNIYWVQQARTPQGSNRFSPCFLSKRQTR